MNNPQPPKKVPSLADFLLRYDLKDMLEEARLDYDQASSGSPRHLDQKNIAARFLALKRGQPKKPQ
jgi:hypothetical protein